MAKGAESYLTTWKATENHEPGVNLAAGAPGSASSSEWNPFTSYAPGRALDGDTGTRWASDWSDDQWLGVDLGAVRRIGRVTLDWERAYARQYRIEVSENGTDWRTVWRTDAGDGGYDTAEFPSTSARYVRFHGERRATQWATRSTRSRCTAPERTGAGAGRITCLIRPAPAVGLSASLADGRSPQLPLGPVQSAGTRARRTRCGWSPTATDATRCPVAKSIAVTRSAPLSEMTQERPSPLTVAQYGLDASTRGPSWRDSRSTTIA